MRIGLIALMVSEYDPAISRAAFDPEMMVALLLYGYCQGQRSSRVIEKR